MDVGTNISREDNKLNLSSIAETICEAIGEFVANHELVIGGIAMYVLIVALHIFKAIRSQTDTLIWNPDSSEYDGLCVYEEDCVNYALYGDEINWPKLLIKSDKNIYNIVMYSNIKWRKGKFEDWELDKNSKCRIKEILTPKECVILTVRLPELIATELLEFENEEHMRFRTPMHANGRYGEISIPVQYKMTWRSWLYFLTVGLVDYKSM